MTRFGYTLMGEGHDPRTLVRNAVLAEQAGFEHAVFSDHYHPWLPSQDHGPFTWTVLGAAAQATERMQLATMVTCPIIRSKPPCRLMSELPNPVNFAAATETVTTETMAEMIPCGSDPERHVVPWMASKFSRLGATVQGTGIGL